jgi:ABC transporter permease protein
MFISAFLYNIAIATFLKKASSVASGTSTIAQIVTFLVPQANSFFGLLYVSISIPIVFGF